MRTAKRSFSGHHDSRGELEGEQVRLVSIRLVNANLYLAGRIFEEFIKFESVQQISGSNKRTLSCEKSCM